MKFKRTAILPFALVFWLTNVPAANARLIPNPDGLTVYDTYLRVTWLANANLPGLRPEPGGQQFDGTFGVQGIDPGGAMSFDTAVAWVQALNNYLGDGYLGHHDWTIPRVPESDPHCTVKNFAYNCMNSALGSLYYRSLPTIGPPTHFGFTAPDTAVPTPPNNRFGPFKNFQPYLYWTSSPGSNNGQSTFSFNTGWQGANHNFHYMYVLPMINHKVHRQGIRYDKLGPGNLETSSDGQMVYDPDALNEKGAKGVTWLADANLAASQHFTIDCFKKGKPCIDVDGSMEYNTALSWLKQMNQHVNDDGSIGWLGQKDWDLAPADPKGGCDFSISHCTGGPMGELFFNQLQLAYGTPVFQMPNNVGPFYNLQPYLYWACGGPDPCEGALDSPPSPPLSDQSWSFSFGNGYQDTDLKANHLYLMVYYPQFPADTLSAGIKDELEGYPALRKRLLAEASQISSATTYRAMLAALSVFDNDVYVQPNRILNADEMSYLTNLAQDAADATGLQPPPPPPCTPHCI